MTSLPLALGQPGRDASPWWTGNGLQLSLVADLPARWLQWLQLALCPDPLFLPSPPEDWDRVMPSLWQHGLWPLVYLRLRDHATWDRLSPGIQAALAQGFQASALRALQLERELGRVLASLVAAGVPVALLKGAAISRVLYASTVERPMGDLDLLVPAEGVDAARDALQRLGYRPWGLTARGRLGRWQRRYRAELPMVGTAPECQGQLVELHWSLAELPYYIDRMNMREVWATAQTVGDLRGAFLPAPPVLLLHACAHLAFHHTRDLRLIWLVDVDRLARWERMDWPELWRLSDLWGVEAAVAGVLRAAADWLATPLPPEARSRWQALPADSVASTMWGLGDERPGRAWRRVRTTWQVFDGPQRLRYGAWLLFRALAQPIEAAGRPAHREAAQGQR